MPHVMDEERDARLDQALSLLTRPARKPSSALMPFVAAVMLAGAGALLIYVLLAVSANKPGTPVSGAQLTSATPMSSQTSPSASPGFELSGSSMSATASDAPAVRDAVIIGTEESR